MSAALPDLTLALGRVTEETRRRLDRGVGEAAAFVAWVRAGAPGANGCVLCGSRGRKELNHVAGRRHGDLVIPLCIACHQWVTERQDGWDGRWQSELRTPELDRSLLILGLMDLTERKAQFVREPGAYLAYAARLRELYAYSVRATI
jgi:hypothetical protein